MATFFSWRGHHNNSLLLSAHCSTRTCQIGGWAALEKIRGCFCKWLHRLTYLSFCDFYSGKMWRKLFKCLHYPRQSTYFKNASLKLLHSIAFDMLARVLIEHDYRLDVCGTTRRTLIICLWNLPMSHKNLIGFFNFWYQNSKLIHGTFDNIHIRN